MKIKKLLILILIIFLIANALVGCTYKAYKTYYSKDDYSKIWNLSGIHHDYNDVVTVFPQSIQNLNVVDFFCRYDEQLPLGEGMQVLLGVKYEDSASYNMEIDKLMSITSDSSNFFKETEFICYPINIGSDSYSEYEYALADNEQKMIYYVFLKNIPQDEVEFDIRFLKTGD